MRTLIVENDGTARSVGSAGTPVSHNGALRFTTDEHEAGEWLNGKTLYSMTASVRTEIDSATNQLAMNPGVDFGYISYIDTVVRVESVVVTATVDNSTGFVTMPFDGVIECDSNGQGATSFHTRDYTWGQVGVDASSTVSGVTLIVTIWYTKKE